jgi:hypothetical protein
MAIMDDFGRVGQPAANWEGWMWSGLREIKD